MAASDAWALVAAGAIGAGGAVLAQMIASVTTGRSNKKREAREDERQKNARFLDIKRELYSMFLLRADKLVEAIDPQHVTPFDTNDTDELQRIHYNIWLVASPEVTREIRIAIADIATAQKLSSLPNSTEEIRSNAKTRAGTAVGAARDALSADLTGYPWPARKREPWPWEDRPEPPPPQKPRRGRGGGVANLGR